MKNLLIMFLFLPMWLGAQKLTSFPIVGTVTPEKGTYEKVLVTFRQSPTDLLVKIDRVIYYDEKGKEIWREAIMEKSEFHEIHVPNGTRTIAVFGPGISSPTHFLYFGKKNYIVEVVVDEMFDSFSKAMTALAPEIGSKIVGVLSDGYGNPIANTRIKGYHTHFDTKSDGDGYYEFTYPVLGAKRPSNERVGASDDLRAQFDSGGRFIYLDKVKTHRREVRWKNLFVSIGTRPQKVLGEVIDGKDHTNYDPGPVNAVVVGPYYPNVIGGTWYRVKPFNQYVMVVSTSENYVDAPFSHVVAKTLLQASYGELYGLGPYYSHMGFRFSDLSPRKTPLIPTESNQKCYYDNRISSFAFNAVNYIGSRRLRLSDGAVYKSQYFSGGGLDSRGDSHPSYVSFNTDNLSWYFPENGQGLNAGQISSGFSKAYGKSLMFK